MSHEGMISVEMQSCIGECLECHRLCMETLTHCLAIGGEHASPEHIGTLLDCADICQTSANFMLRGSTDHPETCRVCALVCEGCAESCEAMAEDDDLMQRCAEACRLCAESCRKMAGSRSHA